MAGFDGNEMLRAGRTGVTHRAFRTDRTGAAIEQPQKRQDEIPARAPGLTEGDFYLFLGI